MKVSCNPEGITEAVNTVKKGGTIVFPTDTVYGFGCDPYNEKAVKSIYEIKKRKKSQLLPVLGVSKKEISKIAEFDNISNIIAENFWPGQVTLILKLKDKKIAKSMNLDNKIAVRVPKNQCVLALLKECKLLIGTSANYSGMKSFTSSQECLKKFSGFDLFIDDEMTLCKGESTIIEIVKGKLEILREGSVSRKEIMKIL